MEGWMAGVGAGGMLTFLFNKVIDRW